MLSFVGVTKEFRLREERNIKPVDNASLQIGDGEFVIILGRSGSGKTTLLNLAAGLLMPTSGHVIMDHMDLGEMTQAQLSQLRSRILGFMFQFPSLIPALNVKDNVTLPGVFSGRVRARGIESRAEELLEMLGLADRMSAYPRHLSAGEAKRVVIARSLINQPRLVLADEPTSDLDSRTEEEVMDILRGVNSTGVTFLIVTHSVQLASFATRVFEMVDGKLVDRITDAHSRHG